jgi:hypothetical protein
MDSCRMNEAEDCRMADLVSIKSPAVCSDIRSRDYPVLAGGGRAPPNPGNPRPSRPTASDRIAGAAAWKLSWLIGLSASFYLYRNFHLIDDKSLINYIDLFFWFVTQTAFGRSFFGSSPYVGRLWAVMPALVSVRLVCDLEQEISRQWG